MSDKKKSVVVAMDGSEHSDYAFQWYMENLHKNDHYVILLYVPERHSYLLGHLGESTGLYSPQETMQEEEMKEKVFLEKLAHKLKDGGIRGKVKRVAGKPGEVICSVADEENAAFVICGSHGKGRLRRTFLGSISDYVIHHSNIPVFICKHKDSKPELGDGSPSLKQRLMNSPLFRKKNRDSPMQSRRKTDSGSSSEGVDEGVDECLCTEAT